MPAPHGGSSRSRGMAILAAAALVAVAMSAMPAMSAKKPLTKRKALKLFHTKDQSDSRYLDQTEGDGRYLRQGNVVISNNGQWSIDSGSAFISDDFGRVRVVATASGPVAVILHLVAPVNLGMRAYGLQNVSICYGVSSGGGGSDELAITEVWEQAPPSPPNVILDNTDRTSTTAECYSVSPAAPYTPTSQGSLILRLVYMPDNNNDSLSIYGIRTTWVSTGAAPA